MPAGGYFSTDKMIAVFVFEKRDKSKKARKYLRVKAQLHVL
jgi:hypothetical protein